MQAKDQHGHRQQAYAEMRGVASNKELWKQKFREKCLKQTKDRRYQAMLMARLRTTNTERVLSEVRADLSNMIKQEWASCKQESDSPDTLTAAEEVELMTFLEEALNRDLELLAQEEIEAEMANEAVSWETAKLQNELDSLHKLVVICPLCKKSALQQVHRIIFCRCGRMKLNICDDAIDLAYLQRSIDEVCALHALRCDKEPQFELRDQFGITALYLLCSHCSFFEVVI